MEVKGITGQLAEFVPRVSFDNLPESAVLTVKKVLLDSIGCAFGGYVTDRAKIALEIVEELGGKPQASIIGAGKTSFALASFANSELINALDYDVGGPGYGHVVPYALPPTLTMAERTNHSGKDLITALAVALEVGGRVAGALATQTVSSKGTEFYEWRERWSYTSAIFGGVAGAGWLLGLDAGKVANAFGIAGASTAVPAGQKWENTPGPAFMAKYNCWSGWISQLAVVATLAAAKGFTGDTTILDGEWGFAKIVGSPFFKSETITDGLGDVWHIPRGPRPSEFYPIMFKKYPCCGANSAFVDVIRKIVCEEGLKPIEIEEILIKGEPMMSTPNRSGQEIRGFADTQFLISYSAAVAVLHGDRVGPFWQLPSTFNDPAVQEMMKKVKVETYVRATEFVPDNNMTGGQPRFRDVVVEITARGRKMIAGAESRDLTLTPISDAELEAKFRDNAAYSPLKTSNIENCLVMLKELEAVDDVAKLFGLLTVG